MSGFVATHWLLFLIVCKHPGRRGIIETTSFLSYPSKNDVKMCIRDRPVWAVSLRGNVTGSNSGWGAPKRSQKVEQLSTSALIVSRAFVTVTRSVWIER